MRIRYRQIAPCIICIVILIYGALARICSAQAIGGDFRNVTLTIGKGMSRDVSLTIQNDDQGQSQATGGITVHEGDKVSFDSAGTLTTKTAGFWKSLNNKAFRVLLSSPNGKKSALVELKGIVRWTSDRNVTDGKENFLRITFSDDSHFLTVVQRDVKDGRLIVTCSDGSKYEITALSPNYAGTIYALSKTTGELSNAMPSPQATTQPDIATDAKKTAMAFITAIESDDMAAAKAISVGSDDQYAVIESTSKLMGAMRRFHEAAVRKYGDAASGLPNFPDLTKNIEASDVTIQGDIATLQDRNNPSNYPLVVKRSGNGWKVDVKSMSGDPAFAELGKTAPNFTKVLQDFAEQIDEGKYKTFEDMQQAMSNAQQ